MSTRRLHRAAPTVGEGGGDNYNVDAAVHSLIADMEEGSDSLSVEHESDLDLGSETEMLFVRSTDPRDLSPATVMLGVMADNENELLAQLETEHAMENRSASDGKKFGFALRQKCASFSKYIPCTLVILFMVVAVSLIISASKERRGSSSSVQGSSQAVPAPPPNLSELCSLDFYDEVRNVSINIIA